MITPRSVDNDNAREMRANDKNVGEAPNPLFFPGLQGGCEKIGTATDFDEILLQFFWIDPRATRVELFEGARQKKGQEFRKSGPVTIFSQPQGFPASFLSLYRSYR